MAAKLFIGSLSFNVTKDQLRDLFAAHGTVMSADIIMDRDTNRSKGFGFVEMSTDAEAQAAINSLNGTELEGRMIAVNVAKPKENRPASNGSRRY